MRQEVNTLSKGRGLPQQLMEQLCLHPNKGASPQPQTGMHIVCQMLCCRLFFVAEGEVVDVDSHPVGSDSAGCLEASACRTSLN